MPPPARRCVRRRDCREGTFHGPVCHLPQLALDPQRRARPAPPPGEQGWHAPHSASRPDWAFVRLDVPGRRNGVAWGDAPRLPDDAAFAASHLEVCLCSVPRCSEAVADVATWTARGGCGAERWRSSDVTTRAPVAPRRSYTLRVGGRCGLDSLCGAELGDGVIEELVS